MSDNHKAAAQARGEKRSADIVRRVQLAMDTISDEINRNGGSYPQNGGALSLNEVARRAKIHSTTLFSQKQKPLLQKARAWLDAIQGEKELSRMSERQKQKDRAEDWKQRYLSLQSSHIKTELDLQNAEADLDRMKKEATQLRSEIEELTRKLVESSQYNVVPIKRRDD